MVFSNISNISNIIVRQMSHVWGDYPVASIMSDSRQGACGAVRPDRAVQPVPVQELVFLFVWRALEDRVTLLKVL